MNVSVLPHVLVLILAQAMTQTTVRLQLAENKAHDLQAGINVSLHDEVSPFILISTGLDLEDQQLVHNS